MRTIFLLFFLFISHFLPAQNTKIAGHWTVVSTGDSLLTLDELFRPGTVTFERIKKYNDHLYQWGGGCYMGMELGKKGEFAFFQNTLCSTESSPVSHTDTNWEMTDAQIITIKGKDRTYRARVLSASRSTLILQFLP